MKQLNLSNNQTPMQERQLVKNDDPVIKVQMKLQTEPSKSI